MPRILKDVEIVIFLVYISYCFPEQGNTYYSYLISFIQDDVDQW